MKLTLQQISEELKNLEGWEFSETENSIIKKFQFQDFKQAIDFVNKIAELSEEKQHHPDISINYNIVTLKLSTHSEQGITYKDLNLARDIDLL